MDREYELDTPKGKNILGRVMYKGKKAELSMAHGKRGAAQKRAFIKHSLRVDRTCECTDHVTALI